MDMDTNGNKPPVKIKNVKSSQQPLLPEQDIYIHLLVLLYLIDNNQRKMVSSFFVINTYNTKLKIKKINFMKEMLRHFFILPATLSQF